MTVTTLLRGGGRCDSTQQHYIGNNSGLPRQHRNNKDDDAATDDPSSNDKFVENNKNNDEGKMTATTGRTTITNRHHDGTVSYCTATKKRNYNNNNEDNDNYSIPIDDNNNNVIRNNQNNHESSSDENETEKETEKIEPEANYDNDNENSNSNSDSNTNNIITSPPTMIISSGRSSQDGKEKIPMESTLFTWRNRNGDALLTTEAMSITRRCVIEFHPLAYLFSVTTSGTNIKKLSNEYNTKINKLNHDIDDIKNRISCIHEKVNILNKQRRERDEQSKGNNNNGDNNEIYLLVRSVGMWMKRMETKTELIIKIQFSLSILNSLKEIDEICSTQIFWFYSTWRRQNSFISNRHSGDDCGNSSWDYRRVNGNNSNWENQDQNQNDMYKNNENRHLFNGYEKAYQRNIKLSTQITSNLINSSSAAGVTADEKIVRLMEYNYIHCKGCRAIYSRRYCDLFGTEVRCPSKIKARENLITRGVTGEADGSNLVVCFFCTDCFDCFNPSIIKQIRQQKEMKKELDLEELIQDCQKEQQQLSTANNNNSNHGGKQPKKRKKKKKKKQQKKNNNATTPSPSATIITNDNDNDNNDCDFCSSSLATKTTTTETTAQSLDINDGVDGDDLDDLNGPLDSNKSVDYGNEHEKHERITIDDTTSDEMKNSDDDVNSDDPAANDVWVDFLLKTGSIIELNAFMDQTLGKD